MNALHFEQQNEEFELLVKSFLGGELSWIAGRVFLFETKELKIYRKSGTRRLSRAALSLIPIALRLNLLASFISGPNLYKDNAFHYYHRYAVARSSDKELIKTHPLTCIRLILGGLMWVNLR